MQSTRTSSWRAIVRERANTGMKKPRCSFAGMNSSTNTAASLSVSRNPSPAELSDAELLAATRSLVGRSNQLLGALLAHLGEVEARGIHRTRACPSASSALASDRETGWKTRTKAKQWQRPASCSRTMTL
jgi:hypothetical protein